MQVRSDRNCQIAGSCDIPRYKKKIVKLTYEDIRHTS